VLPPQLEKMSLFIHPEMIANEWEDGYARLFISALPLVTADSAPQSRISGVGYGRIPHQYSR
jgi:hypothetical protein